MKYFLTAAFMALFSLSVTAKELSGPAPGLTLQTFDGKKVSLSDYKGQVIMLNFWASWCGPCRQEMPELNKLYDTYKKAGFVLLGINLDDSKAAVDKALQKTPVTFPVLLDPQGKVAELYKNQAMPSSYFIDRDGNLAYLHQGYRPGEEAEYKKIIRKLLAQ